MTSNGSELAMTSSPSISSATVTISTTASPQTVVIKGKRFRQRPLGPAPFASFEDLSDELDSPPEAARVPLPGIKEDPASQIQTPNTPQATMMPINLTEQEEQGLKEALAASLDTPAPPRIDISRASSSSQHEDSITSSPEREGTHNLGYKEDGTLDLRSSTEELDYIQEPGTVEESEAKRKREKMMKKQQQLKHDFGDTQSEYDIKERKDSNCSVVSDVGLLCISGRTSRLSSIGSAASGASVASGHSGASHLSVGSHLSGRSTRSPSPHKMLLETSFCGSKPMHTQSIEAEAAPGLVQHVEKAASRPPSRIRSRSPSPHKMLLETSFCGTKAIIPPSNAEKNGELAGKVPKRRAKSLTPAIVTAAEIVPQKVQKETSPRPSPAKSEIIKPTEPPPPKPEKKVPPKMDEIKKADDIKPVKAPVKAKPVSLPKLLDKKLPSKPKKVISLRDIPADEIYIPLKGPEVDFEEIIRKASPNLRRKVEPVVTVTDNNPNEIYIPLHSPPKDPAEKKEESEERTTDTTTFKQNFDDGIYIPLHSPPKSPKPPVSISDKKPVADRKSDIKSKTKTKTNSVSDKYQKSYYEPKKTKYEVCEDGSIIIPLHSPEEERNARTFEEEIRRVDQELQKAREAAERRQREADKQEKPVTLDLVDNRSRLSQTFPSGKPDLASGSRTPSPGSSLSRKSSFASLFRKSDVSCSPDSPAGSLARKKSGTFTNILKEASDGLRERSRSRSKSRERQPHASVVRSPSIKKNVFTNLFTKKKADTRPVSGKADDEQPPRLDLQFTFNTESESKSSEGDYIIIPLRDPNDPPASLDDDIQDSSNQGVIVERPPSPVVILERSDSPKSARRSREIEEHVQVVSRSESKRSIDRVSVTRRSVGDDQISIGDGRRSVADDRRSIGDDRRSISSDKRSAVQSPDFGQESFVLSTVGAAYGSTTPISFKEKKIEEAAIREKAKFHSREKTPSPKPEPVKQLKEKTPSPVVEQRHQQQAPETIDRTELLDPKKFEDMALQHDSSIDLEEDTVKEEMVAVSSGGVRKLKLPPEPGDLEEDHERKGLVLQESFDDELPYVPTTLPLERSVGIPIVPVKHRVAEIKTCPIERPRSTTPINPASLEDYVTSKDTVRVSAEEKMKISLPREDSTVGRAKSPRRFSGAKGGKSWFEFAEAGLQSPRDYRKSSLTTTPSPPPLPPRASPPSTVGLSTSAPQSTASWINFDELPEKRKLPKRITTVPPLRSSVDGGALPEKSNASSAGNVVYSYVSPEDCQCECHDHGSHHGNHGNHGTSHVKESDPKRGTRRKTNKPDGDINGEYLTQSHQTKRKLFKPQGDSEKSVTNECEDCESGRHVEVEGDIEERPLLDNNSDGENDDSSSRKETEWELVVPGSRLEVDRQSHLSDSSYDCTSHEATSTGGPDNSVSEIMGMKPFGMDLDVHSNRSSIVSQEEQPSPEEVSNSLPPCKDGSS